MKSKSFTFKKGLALLLSLLMLTTGIPMSVLADTVVTEEVVDAAPAEEGSILYGDADDNGLVNLLDPCHCSG